MTGTTDLLMDLLYQIGDPSVLAGAAGIVVAFGLVTLAWAKGFPFRLPRR